MSMNKPPIERWTPIRIIQEEICRKHDLTMEQLVGRCRSLEFAIPRQEAFYLARRHTQASMPEIGYAFNRDHTTVLHGIRKHEQRAKLSVIASSVFVTDPEQTSV